MKIEIKPNPETTHPDINKKSWGWISLTMIDLSPKLYVMYFLIFLAVYWIIEIIAEWTGLEFQHSLWGFRLRAGVFLVPLLLMIIHSTLHLRILLRQRVEPDCLVGYVGFRMKALPWNDVVSFRKRFLGGRRFYSDKEYLDFDFTAFRDHKSLARVLGVIEYEYPANKKNLYRW